MKIECKKCEHIFTVGALPYCPKCQNVGGFTVEPSLKSIGGFSINRQDELTHQATGTKYKVKEFQKNGFLAVITKTMIPVTLGKTAYISNSNIGEYRS